MSEHRNALTICFGYCTSCPQAMQASLLKQCRIRSCVVRLDHVDRVCVILVRVVQTVGDVGLCLSVAADVRDVQVQQIIILLKQRLIGRAQEVIGRVVDVKPDVLCRSSFFTQLVRNRRIDNRGIKEVFIVVGSNRKVQCVVGT